MLQTAPMIASVSVLFLCTVIMVVSLVYLQRHDLYCKCSHSTQCNQVQDGSNMQVDPSLQNKEPER